MLDSIRAVAELPNVGPLGTVMLAGHSQGGRAALVAAEIAPEYAPSSISSAPLALAPGVELPAFVDYLVAPPGTGIVLIGAIGLRAGYPELDLSTVFTPSAVADIPHVRERVRRRHLRPLSVVDLHRRHPSRAQRPARPAGAPPGELAGGRRSRRSDLPRSRRRRPTGPGRAVRPARKTSTAPLGSQSLEASTRASATTTSSTPQARTPSPSSPTASTTNLRPLSVEDRFCAVPQIASGALCETPRERPG